MIAAVTGAVLAGAYLWGVHLYRARYPDRSFGSSRIAAFLCGVALLCVALSPAVEAWADRSFAAHMAQHVVLLLIAPPLMLLGAPLLLLVSVPPARAARGISGVVRHPFVHALLAPITGWLLFVFVMWGAHFSPLYEAALEHESVHVLEHLLFVGVAFLFWMPVVQAGYAPRPMPFAARMLYLFLAVPQGAFLGLAIYSSRHILYAHYAATQSTAAALADQQNGGAVMWIAGGFLLFVAFMVTGAAWAYSERGGSDHAHASTGSA